MKHRILEEARAEFREAKRWYDERRTGLGQAFNDEVLAKIRFLRRFPRGAPAWPDDPTFRCATLHRFPYRIFYFIDDDMFVVAAIAHHRRRPGYWRKRLG
jgi:plasmid stabilization system protein ParE